jgi:hypothetical protein
MTVFGLLQSTFFFNRFGHPKAQETKQTTAGKDQQILSRNCLFRKIQRSPRPGLKQKASQYPGEPNFYRNLPDRISSHYYQPVRKQLRLMEK